MKKKIIIAVVAVAVLLAIVHFAHMHFSGAHDNHNPEATTPAADDHAGHRP